MSGTENGAEKCSSYHRIRVKKIKVIGAQRCGLRRELRNLCI